MVNLNFYLYLVTICFSECSAIQKVYYLTDSTVEVINGEIRLRVKGEHVLTLKFSIKSQKPRLTSS